VQKESMGGGGRIRLRSICHNEVNLSPDSNNQLTMPYSTR